MPCPPPEGFALKEVGWAAIGRYKNQRPLRAVVTVEAGQSCKSAFGALLDEITTYQVVGSVVDYLASNGSGGLGFDSGEGA